MINVGSDYQVVSGRLRNQQVRVLSASDVAPSFWNCAYHTDVGNGIRRHEVVLAASQLVRKEVADA